MLLYPCITRGQTARSGILYHRPHRFDSPEEIRNLIGYGYSCGPKGVDGSFGRSTDEAVRKYQKNKGLAVDGSVGPATWASLLGV